MGEEGQKMKANRMYKENRKSINAFVGCLHNCVYCKPSFQRQMKRQRKRCELCYNYTPHSHLERLSKAPPKTKDKEFIFFPSSGDLAWASRFTVESHIGYARKYKDRMFLIQSKNPKFFLNYEWPPNVILGTTIETTERYWFAGPSKFKAYKEISKAPYPDERFKIMLEVREKFPDHQIIVTIEPILTFNPNLFPEWIEAINPDIVYVGYDNHSNYLPEPRLEATLKLIDALEKFTEVRKKTIRHAWWEK